MTDDPWAAWAPTTNPNAKAQEAYQARRAMSRDLSADPMSPRAAGSSKPFAARQAPSGPPARATAPTPSTSGTRRPLPDQSFPGFGRGAGPSRSGAGWQRSQPAGHIDHGWASKTGHEEPISKPIIVGDIESASNAPLTEGQRRDLQNTRSSRQDVEDRNRHRLPDERQDASRSIASSRDNKRPRSRERERERSHERGTDGGRYRDSGRDRYRERDSDGDRARGTDRERERDRPRDRPRDRDRARDTHYDRDRDIKRPRRDEDDHARRSRRRSRSRSRSRERVRREDGRDRRRDERSDRRRDERSDRRRDDRDIGRDLPSSSHSDRSVGREPPNRIKEESPMANQQKEAERPQSRSRTPEPAPVKDGLKDTADAPLAVKSHSIDYAVIVRGIHEGATVEDVETILGDYGKLSYCQKLPEEYQPGRTAAYKVAFTDLEGAVNAVSNLNGQVADGNILHVSLAGNVLESNNAEATNEEIAQQPASPKAEPELKLKGFASLNNKDSSLLSRLGAPVKPSSKANGAGKTNGSSTAKLPSLLQPYDDLLQRAGVDSLDKLKRLVRSGTVKEYIEMLCEEFPDEELLNGLTARWALKERLEEWLGEKGPLKMDWNK